MQSDLSVCVITDDLQ